MRNPVVDTFKKHVPQLKMIPGFHKTPIDGISATVLPKLVSANDSYARRSVIYKNNPPDDISVVILTSPT